MEAFQAKPASRPRPGQPAGQPVQHASHDRGGHSPPRAPLPLLRPKAVRKEKLGKIGQRPSERINPGSLPGQASQPAKARPASRPTIPAGQPRARGPLPPRAPLPLLRPEARRKEKRRKLGQRPGERTNLEVLSTNPGSYSEKKKETKRKGKQRASPAIEGKPKP
jgi:hypothetical protein